MKPSRNVLITTHVPVNNLESIQKAVWSAWAWVEGNYKNCGFIMKGKWYFTPILSAKPAIWELGRPEQVEEYYFEFTCKKEILEKVIFALKKAHPYEEVPIQIFEYFEV